MALALAVGAGPQELDLGGQQELADLVLGWGVGMDWSVPAHLYENVQTVPVARYRWEMKTAYDLKGSHLPANMRSFYATSVLGYLVDTGTR